jgi:hypothetical protein
VAETLLKVPNVVVGPCLMPVMADHGFEGGIPFAAGAEAAPELLPA